MNVKYKIWSYVINHMKLRTNVPDLYRYGIDPRTFMESINIPGQINLYKLSMIVNWAIKFGIPI